MHRGISKTCPNHPGVTLPARGAVFLVAMAVIAVACGAAGPTDSPDDEPDQPSFRVLVFSRTTGFRHTSIPDGRDLIQELGAEEGFGVDLTEDPAAFSADNLSTYATVIFLNTTGDVLNDLQQAVFEEYIQGGGGFVGIHSAADTEYDWPWYGQLIGTWFLSHPTIQKAEVTVEDPSHPSTRHLPDPWTRTDEWYDFQSNPRPSVQVLLTVDESTYDGGQMDSDHPIAWYQEFDGGRAWYTAGGHTSESYREPLFADHILGGIQWTVGLEE